MTSEPTYGSRYRALASARERLELEDTEGRRAAFAEVDATIERLVLAALHGDRIIASDGTLAVTDAEREALVEHFSMQSQQKRGAWYEPKLTNLATGHVQLVHWWRKAPRYALSLADSERLMAASWANAARQANTDLVGIWAALEPTFEEARAPAHAALRSHGRTEHGGEAAAVLDEHHRAGLCGARRRDGGGQAVRTRDRLG